MTSELIGLPLEKAIDRLNDENIFPEICYTYAPNRNKGEGSARVVRVQNDGQCLTVAFFQLKLENIR